VGACADATHDSPGVIASIARRRIDGELAISGPTAGTEEPPPRVGAFAGCDITPTLGLGEAHGSLNVLIRVNRPRHPLPFGPRSSKRPFPCPGSATFCGNSHTWQGEKPFLLPPRARSSQSGNARVALFAFRSRKCISARSQAGRVALRLAVPIPFATVTVQRGGTKRANRPDNFSGDKSARLAQDGRSPSQGFAQSNHAENASGGRCRMSNPRG
jgi:hypothetical protein